MSLVGVAHSLMSAFLLSYFLFSCSRGRLLINKARLLGNKAGLLIGRKTLNHHSKKTFFFIENNLIIVCIYRIFFVNL